MKSPIYGFGLLILICAACFDAEANMEENCASLQHPPTQFTLDNAISFFEDKGGQKTIQDALNSRPESWTLLNNSVPSFGFSSSAYWFKFELCPSQFKQPGTVLEISYPMLDSIHVFGVSNGTIIYQEHTGDKFPYSQKSVKHRYFIFDLPEINNAPLQLFIRVQTESALQVPLKLYTPTGFSDHNQTAHFFQGGYFGIILAMLLYNTFLFFSVRELPYLYYVLFTLSFFSFQAVLQGFFPVFISDSVWWQNHAILIFGFASIFFANYFSISFLNLQKTRSACTRGIKGLGWLSLLAALCASVLSYKYMVKAMLLFAIVSSVLIMFTGFRQWIIGHLPARIFTLAWVTLLLSFIIASLTKFGVLPGFFWTENIMQIGGVIEVILLSIALGERINTEKQQRILVEQRLSTSLEEQVLQRTQSLNEALQKLEAANTTLDKLSTTDGLTQIANRRAFDACIRVELKNAKRDLSPLSLIMIDIDHFKNINDTHGHPAGDQVLQAIAKQLEANASRPRDKAFRYGGEEFAVVLSNTKLKGAKIVAEKMRKAIAALQLKFENKPCPVTISAGISMVFPTVHKDGTESPVKLISQADAMLYLAKKNGRNRVENCEVVTLSQA